MLSCEHANTGDRIVVRAQPNAALDLPNLANSDGFVLSLNGETVDGDPSVEDDIRRVDVAIEQADVKVQLDTLDPEPRLDLEVTGGSAEFLKEQDISPGTQTLTIELRDKTTGHIVESVVLVEGRDYSIDSLQGLFTLRRPITGSVNSRLISTLPGGDQEVRLSVSKQMAVWGIICMPIIMKTRWAITRPKLVRSLPVVWQTGLRFRLR